MPYTPPSAGQTITAAMWAELASFAVPVQAVKAGDTSRNTTTTATADPDLVIVLPANRTYLVDASLSVISAANAAGDFKCGFEWTNTATLYVLGWGLSAAGLASGSITDLEAVAQTVSSTPTIAIAYGASTTPTAVLRRVRVVTGGSNVTLSMTWAQQTSNGNNTTLQAGSSITARRVD